MNDLPYHYDWKPQFETSLGLRVKWFGRWGGNASWSIEPSRLGADLVCFFYLEAGSATAEINGVRLPMNPGEMVVLRGADVFSFTQDTARPQTSLSACLSLDRDASANDLMQLTYRRHYRLRDGKAYERSFASVLEALGKEGSWRNLHVTAAIFQWLADLHDELGPVPGVAAGNPKTVHHVLAAQEWMQQRLGEDVTILAWSAACGLNADYFGRLFKAHTGMAPKAWLIEARLQRACRLLSYMDATVEEVAGRCGFNCPFHFSRSFKSRFGLPPAGYRRVRQIRALVEPTDAPGRDGSRICT